MIRAIKSCVVKWEGTRYRIEEGKLYECTKLGARSYYIHTPKGTFPVPHSCVKVLF